MSYLHSTRKQFLDVVTPQSPAQLSFKPEDGGWSVGEIAEHLTVTEAGMLTRIHKALSKPPTPEKKSETAGKDDIIFTRVPDRTHTVEAPKAVPPNGRWPSRDALVGEFKLQRDKTIEFIEKTPADLRSHMFPHPFLKLLDCYQWVLFLAAHCDRHIQQMKEVMASPNFPKR